MSAASAPVRVEAAARTHRGHVRRVNQDVALVDGWASGAVATTLRREALVDETTVALAVIDGMGGHASGEIAAWLAAQVLGEGLQGLSDAAGADALALAASDRIVGAAQGLGAPDMGAAFAALLVGRDSYAVVNVGDCRVYRLTEGVLGLLTLDDLGPSRTDPGHHVLTQCLGGGVRIALDAHWYERAWGRSSPAAPERFLLASDGLAVVDPADVSAALELPVEAAAEALIGAALAVGAPDNTTVIVVDVWQGGALEIVSPR